MQKVFEKIIEKLEIQKDYYKTIRKNTYCRRTEMDDCDSCRADHYLEARLSAIDDAIEIVKQESEQYNNGWIPCSERLPNQDGEFTDVLITCESVADGVFVQSAEFYIAEDGEPVFDALYHYERVLAWMPLPQPYTKGE